MGISALLACDVEGVRLGPVWQSSDGKDYARVMGSPRCKALLEEHIQFNLDPVLGSGRHDPNDVLRCIDRLIARLPDNKVAEWTEDERERYGYLYTELSGELAGDDYFDDGWFLKDLRDLRQAVEKAIVAGATSVHYFFA